MTSRKLLASALALVLFAGGCKPPPPTPEETARTFVQALVENKPGEAYGKTAFSFRAMQSESAFSAAALELGLNGGKISSVSPPEVEERRTRVRISLVNSRNEDKSYVVT